MPPTVKIDLSFNLVQQLRLAHAIAEAGWTLSVRGEHVEKFSLLVDLFGIDLRTDAVEDAFDLTPHLSVSHAEPRTGLGTLSRPLVFPKAIGEHCRSLWPARREQPVLFQGLMTTQRARLIGDWIERRLSLERLALPRQDTRLSRYKRKLLSALGLDDSVTKHYGPLKVASSSRGRRFPIKSWDAEYYRELASAEFVLCPSGDFIWSYRFFESALCGANLLIEAPCEAYEGFRFKTFDDPVDDLAWSADDAEHNYRLAMERLTLPDSEINDEINRLGRLSLPAG